jgi:hypothetical protein
VALLLAGVLAVPHAFAQRHIVSADQLAARLCSAEAERSRNLLKIDRILSNPIAGDAGLARGLDMLTLRAGVVALNDDELRDLAARADALGADPLARGGKKTWLIVGIAVLVTVVLVVLFAKDCKDPDGCLDEN